MPLLRTLFQKAIFLSKNPFLSYIFEAWQTVENHYSYVSNNRVIHAHVFSEKIHSTRSY